MKRLPFAEHMRRRHLAALLSSAPRAVTGVMLALAFVAACRSGAPSGETPTPAGTPAAAAQPATPVPAAPAPPPAGTPTPAATPAPPPGPLQIRTPPPLASLGVHRLIPAPVSVLPADGPAFSIGMGTAVVVPAGDRDAARVGQMLATLLRASTGFRLPVTPAAGALPRGAIALRLVADTAMGDEGYELLISADSVRLAAARPAGLFRGMQTLRQLLPVGIEAEQSQMRMATAWTVPAGRIVDRPRFAWRGGMLDVARHFFTVKEVEQYIDLLAMYKLNVLHLHLSDDQGWRIQIDSWPKLTSVGGSTQVGGGAGGFYTKREYAEIVRYAQERFITVVPEIDMPGHTNAAIAAYPQLGCSRPTPAVLAATPTDTQPPGPYTGIRVGWSALCAEKEVTYRFVDDVMRELAAMTPGPYLHIGGDEVEVLTPELYARFVERVQDIVVKRGKIPVGWEEIGKARLRPGTIAQKWKADTALLAARQGARLIMSPGPRAYIDMKYNAATEPGLRWAGFIELRQAYEWEPTTIIPGTPAGAVLGVEAPMWSETVQNITAAMFLLVPRLPAISEVAWSAPEARGWESFRTRIAAHAPRWRLLGVNYYPSPQVDWQ